MAPVIDQDTRRADADTLAAMAGPLRDRVIEDCIELEEGRTQLLFDGPDIFEDLDPGA